MRSVREVRCEGEARTRWTARGPSGVDVTWTLTTTRYEPNWLLAWHSDDGASVSIEGALQLFPVDDGRTHLRVWMTYALTPSLVGRSVVAIFGPDPKHEMEEDLERAKVILETGDTSRDSDDNPPPKRHA